MRTTVTLDPDIAERLSRYAQQRHFPFKRALNLVLREGLEVAEAEQNVPFVLEPFSSPFRAGVDMQRLNQLADDLDVKVSR